MTQGQALPSPWIDAYLELADSRRPGRVLDVACGNGRHLLLAHQRGYQVVGIDRDVSGARDAGALVSAGAGVTLLQADLETDAPWPMAGQTFDVVIVTNYLHRPQLAAIVANVAPGGVLIYETFAVGHERFGRPTNPDFLLQPGELLRVVDGCLTPIVFEHGQLVKPDRMVQRIVAVGAHHHWHRNPPRLSMRHAYAPGTDHHCFTGSDPHG
jgi:SAM-dependent methyltransferase